MKYIVAIALALVLSASAKAEDIWRPGTVQAVPFDAVSVRTTTAFGRFTNVARVVCSTSCYVAIGVSPRVIATAATGVLLPALIPEYFSVAPGEHFAVIRLTTTGTLNVTEMTK